MSSREEWYARARELEETNYLEPQFPSASDEYESGDEEDEPEHKEAGGSSVDIPSAPAGIGSHPGPLGPFMHYMNIAREAQAAAAKAKAATANPTDPTAPPERLGMQAGTGVKAKADKKTKQPPARVKCDMCSRTYSRQCDLTRHIKNKHP